MQILTNISSDRKDFINASNSTPSIKEFKDKVLNIDKIFVFEKLQAGETKTVVVLHDKDTDSYMSSTSQTILDSVESIISVFNKDEILAGVGAKVMSKLSRNNREFFYLDIM